MYQYRFMYSTRFGDDATGTDGTRWRVAIAHIQNFCDGHDGKRQWNGFPFNIQWELHSDVRVRMWRVVQYMRVYRCLLSALILLFLLLFSVQIESKMLRFE